MSTAAIDTPAETPDGLRGSVRFVEPPARLRRFQVRSGEGPGTWVSYREHAAYALLAAESGVRERIEATAIFAKYFLLILFKRLISYELIPTHLRDLRSPAGVFSFMRAAIGNVARKLVRGRGPLVMPENRVAAALAVDGICVTQIDSAHLSRLTVAAQPLFDQLHASRAHHAGGGRRFEESRSYAMRTAHGDLFAAVEAALRTTGILDGVSSLLDRQARLVDVNPQINDPTDDFWRRIFPDLPESERPLAYLHRDASGGDVKAILYMSDVGPESGPFSYTLGSHRVRSGNISDWIEETNDQSACSGTGLRNRARFAALPKVLQRKCAFGNDILANTEIAERLLSAEWTVTADRGHIVLFDTKGFHRGGMVTRGERLVLTCVIG